MKIIVVGAGEVGFHIASRLTREDKDVVVIDVNEEALQRLSETVDVQTLLGSGSNPSILEEAGIQNAEILLAVTNSDEVNLVACMLADNLSPSTTKLARLRSGGFDRYYEAFKTRPPHIDTVINQEIEVVQTLHRLMSIPGAVDVGEFADGKIKFVGVYLAPESPLANVRLMDLPKVIQDLHPGVRAPLIPAVVRGDQLIIPKGNDVLKGGDLVYFISEEEKLVQHMAVFGKQATTSKRILIIGGGRVGYRLAKDLEHASVSVKIIEKNVARCEYLADKLDRTMVLHGDGSDQNLLLEENIQDMDLAITLTSDEETNILASLLVRRLGAKKTITRIDKFSYFPLMSAIGIEQVVSPRLSAINTILQHVRRGKVLSTLSIKGEEGEVMEAVALSTSDIVAAPLKKIAFPKGAIVAGIIRGETIIIPMGDTRIEPDDRVIIFATRDAIPGVEKILAVKLEYI
ncbi:Trk system potassium transporter TrkA [Desulfosarcina sp. OttesenSCG-928-A07]|nr:Trk system potassium transporter TrkA [Desulfosarcina sp. OttesenSCG-928-G17]MDL2329135.1 Trk system potassium transporter TrkA [Desulfosarcina sp. OttesenSCG-928-A07]